MAMNMVDDDSCWYPCVILLWHLILVIIQLQHPARIIIEIVITFLVLGQ